MQNSSINKFKILKRLRYIFVCGILFAMDKELLKQSANFDEEFKPSDYTVEELEEISKKNLAKTDAKNKKKKNAELQKFKEQYFSYYDDIKSSSLKKQDG